jgi:dethiobiotin synthetase
MFRPKQLVGIVGTHTEVGKTYVASRWLAHLRGRGLKVAARKPVQSYDPADNTTDAAQLACATGESITHVCRSDRNYPLAFAPPMAADALHRPRIAMNDLVDEISWPGGVDIGVVETVGGPLSPLAHDGASIELVRRLPVDHVVLVADAGLGTLNSVRLSLQCIAPLPVTVYLNRYDASHALHALNRSWLIDRYGITTVCDLSALTNAVKL